MTFKDKKHVQIFMSHNLVEELQAEVVRQRLGASNNDRISITLDSMIEHACKLYITRREKR